MNKKLLIVYYSQSGQLEDIVNNFSLPFNESGVSIEKVRIKPKNDFLFPWTSDRFFDAMPESVLGIPIELESFELKETSYDLIIFAYQPWYLSPSIPAISVLQHPAFKKVLQGASVLTLIGARNMWLNAQESVKRILKESGARLVGNIVLTDKNSNLVSAITILHWMMTGKKDRYFGIFPKPGIADEDILHSNIYARMVNEFLKKDNWSGLQENLVRIKALEVKTDLMFIESRAGKLFLIWANIIRRRKNRGFFLILFKYYLMIALFIVAPIVLIINGIFFKPFLRKIINKKKQYYLGVN